MSNQGGVQDKQIRFTVGMDEASIRKGIGLLREFQREAQKLAQDLNRAMGGLGGGGQGRPAAAMMVGGGGLNVAQQTGRASPIAQQQGAGGVGGALTKQILENKQLFQAVATGSKDALRIMSGALKDEVGKQQMDIRRLRKEVEDLNREYAVMQKFKGAGRLYVGDQDAVRGQLLSKYDELGSAQHHESLLQKRYAQLNGGGGAAGGAGGGGGIMQTGAMRALGAMGVTNGMVQAGGVAAVGYVIGKTIANTLRSGAAEAAASPHDYINRSVKQGGAYGSAAMGIRGGDLSLMHAFSVMRGNSWMNEDFNRLQEGSQGIGGRGSIMPSGFEKGRMGGTEFNRSNWRFWNIAARNVWHGIAGMDPLGAVNNTVRDRDNVPVQQAGEMLDYAQKMEQANPMAFAGVRHFQETTGAMIGWGRGLGSGTRLRPNANRFVEEQTTDASGRVVENNSYHPNEKINNAARTMRSYQNKAISPEEVLAGQHAVASVAGYHAGQSLRHQAIYGNLGGHMPNAGLMAGTGALVGNKGLWGQFTGALGGNGGMDVGAGSRMAGTLSGALLGGNPITSGQGLLGALYQYGRGSSGAQDMLLQNFMPQGLAAMGQVTGGGIDGYQSGSNLLNAIQALPGGSVMAQEYLAQLDPATIAEVMATGVVPPELKARGITPDAVKGFASKTFSRAYDRNIGASPGQEGRLNDVQIQAKMVNEQYGGDFKKYLDDNAGKLKGKDRDAFVNQAMVNQGAFYQDIGWAGSDMAGQSLARIQAGLGTNGSYVNGKRVAGRGGPGDPMANSDQMKQHAKTSEFEGDNERWIEENTDHIQGMVAQRRQAMEGLNQVGQSVGMAADQVATRLNGLADAIEQAERRIRGRPATGNAAPKR